MAEYDRLAGAPILVEDFDTVSGGDDGHGTLSSLLLPSFRGASTTRSGNLETVERCSGFGSSSRPDGKGNQTNAIGLNRRHAPMITSTKNTKTMPCTTPNTGPEGGAGGTLGATACNAGTLRNAWMIRTKMFRYSDVIAVTT